MPFKYARNLGSSPIEPAQAMYYGSPKSFFAGACYNHGNELYCNHQRRNTNINPVDDTLKLGKRVISSQVMNVETDKKSCNIDLGLNTMPYISQVYFKICCLFEISCKFVIMCLIENTSSLVQELTWCRTSDDPVMTHSAIYLSSHWRFAMNMYHLKSWNLICKSCEIMENLGQHQSI